MKSKSSWELKKGESVYSEKEKKDRKSKYLSTHTSKNSKKKFLCQCGKYHTWKELGQAHEN